MSNFAPPENETTDADIAMRWYPNSEKAVILSNYSERIPQSNMIPPPHEPTADDQIHSRLEDALTALQVELTTAITTAAMTASASQDVETNQQEDNVSSLRAFRSRLKEIPLWYHSVLRNSDGSDTAKEAFLSKFRRSNKVEEGGQSVAATQGAASAADPPISTVSDDPLVKAWQTVNSIARDVLGDQQSHRTSIFDDRPAGSSVLVRHEADTLRYALKRVRDDLRIGTKLHKSEALSNLMDVATVVMPILQTESGDSECLGTALDQAVPRWAYVASLAEGVKTSSSYAEVRSILRPLMREVELRSIAGCFTSRHSLAKVRQEVLAHLEKSAWRPLCTDEPTHWQDLDPSEQKEISEYVLGSIASNSRVPIIAPYIPREKSARIKLGPYEQVACVESTHGRDRLIQALGLDPTLRPDCLRDLEAALTGTWKSTFSNKQMGAPAEHG